MPLYTYVAIYKGTSLHRLSRDAVTTKVFGDWNTGASCRRAKKESGPEHVRWV